MQVLNWSNRVMAGALACAVTALAWAQTPAPAQKTLAASAGVFAYPAKGQKSDEQAKDEAECFNWSKTQSGYDPMSPQASTPAPSAQGQAPAADGTRARGALRGAAAGAAIGAIAGDTGKGAAIGATAGVFAGGRQSRMAQSQQKEQAAQEAKTSQQDLVNGFKRGMTVCLEARGYTVK